MNLDEILYKEIYNQHNCELLLIDIVSKTMYIMVINDDNVVENIGDDIFNNISKFGFIHNKVINNRYLLSEKGLQFLLWLRENHLDEIVKIIDNNYYKFYFRYGLNRYFKFLIPKDSISIVLSMSNYPEQLIQYLNLVEETK